MSRRKAMVSIQRSWGRSMQVLCKLLQPCQFIRAFLGDLAGLVLWGPPFLLSPWLLLSLFHEVPWPLTGGIWWRYLTESCVFQVLSMQCLAWVSVFAPSCYTRDLLWWWLTKLLIHEYSRISLWVISLLLPAAPPQTGILGFTLTVWTSGHLKRVRHEFYLMEMNEKWILCSVNAEACMSSPYMEVLLNLSVFMI